MEPARFTFSILSSFLASLLFPINLYFVFQILQAEYLSFQTIHHFVNWFQHFSILDLDLFIILSFHLFGSILHSRKSKMRNCQFLFDVYQVFSAIFFTQYLFDLKVEQPHQHSFIYFFILIFACSFLLFLLPIINFSFSEFPWPT